MAPQPDSPVPLDEPLHDIRVIRMLARDLPEAADLHLRALPPSFFASLGPRFLRRYHESFLGSPQGIALVAMNEQQFCGFVLGSADAADHSAWVVRHRGLRLAIAAVLAMSTRPGVFAHFVSSRSARYLRGLVRRLRHQPQAAAGAAPTSARPAVLAHVAVHNAWRRMGVGEILVRAFERDARRLGAARVELVTLAGPDGAGRFYERLGYTNTGTKRDGDGRQWTYFSLDCSTQDR